MPAALKMALRGRAQPKEQQQNPDYQLQSMEWHPVQQRKITTTTIIEQGETDGRSYQGRPPAAKTVATANTMVKTTTSTVEAEKRQ